MAEFVQTTRKKKLKLLTNWRLWLHPTPILVIGMGLYFMHNLSELSTRLSYDGQFTSILIIGVWMLIGIMWWSDEVDKAGQELMKEQ